MTENPKTERCNDKLAKMLKTSVLIKFLFEQIQLSGCTIPKITCVQTENKVFGAISSTGDIELNPIISSRTHLETTLAHELVHVYDKCTVDFDQLNLKHLACTEVRANTLSGECRLSREIMRGQLGISGHFKYLFSDFRDCVFRRSVLGMQQLLKNGDEKIAREAVSKVFDACFGDLAPFDEIY